jgi:Holliday junction resolvase RusA-like endonuclease
MIEFCVIGLPGPQGSKRHVGNGRMIESSDKVRPWREAVKWTAYEYRKRIGAPMIIGPVVLEVTFTLPKPKGAPKRRRIWPDKKPDLSKLVRSTEDALTEAAVWEDDARVVRTISDKTYPNEHPHALDVPGAVIRIYPMTEDL